MGRENILAIDNGTQSVRALLFDPQGNLLAKEQVFYEPYTSPQPGYAELDARDFWKHVCEACQRLWKNPQVKKDSIAAVSLTTQRSTVINVDKNGNPLRPAIVWPDQRRAKNIKPVGGLWGLAFKAARLSDTIKYLQAECEANWIMANQPEIWKKTHKYLFLSGYLTYLLTGDFVDSIGSQVGYVPFDYKAQDWAEDWSWRWQAIRMERDLLPDLVPPSHELGQITAWASGETGIPVGLPLIASAADKATEVIGSGCLDPHIAHLSYGTTATINTTHEKYIEVIPMIPPYPAAVPNHYTLEVQIYRGYWMVTWFKEEFGHKEVEIAKVNGERPEPMFDELVNMVPPGSDGLVLQPYWSPGLRSPGPEAKGAIIGFNAAHTRAHLYRAILEGVGYALREGKERTEKRSRVPISELRVSGGGSQSDAAMQITADIFGLPAYRPHTWEASGLGAAINAAVGVGLHPDFASAVKTMTHVGDCYEPDPTAHKIYNDLYEGVYKRMYRNLKPLYYAIADSGHDHMG